MKKLLLHSCCAPCSTQVIDVLRADYDITIFYYNPNLDTEEEYILRLSEQKRFCKEVGIKVIEQGHCPNDFLSMVKGLENEPEGGARCGVCFKIRLLQTAKKAKELGFDLFGTTLTVSPHKNAEVINSIGRAVQEKEGVEFLEGNYKKQDGYKKSIEFSKQYNLYRQNYCGCSFAKNKE